MLWNITYIKTMWPYTPQSIRPLSLLTYISTGNTGLPEGEWPENAFHDFINI